MQKHGLFGAGLKKGGYYHLCSFIHYMNLYSASSRLLLRSAPTLQAADISGMKINI